MTNTKFMSRFLFLFIISILVTFKAFSQNKIYVNINASGSNNGTSWINAFQQLQAAIDAANVGDSIWVAAGTYYPTLAFDADNSGSAIDREKTFYIDKNIILHGQFQGTETLLSQRNKAHQTILSGDLGVPQDTSDNAFHIIYIDGATNNGAITNNTVLDGFIIEQGQATGSNFPNNSGAGIFNNGQGIGNECSPSFKNLTLKQNIAAYQGGAIYNSGSTSSTTNLLMDELTFDFNTAQYGAVSYNHSDNGTFNVLLTNSTCTNNSNSMNGAVFHTNANNGIANLIISDTHFENNIANSGAICYNHIDNGGAVFISFSNNTAKGNLVQLDGGIMSTNNNNQGTYTLIAENNKFYNNLAAGNGAISYTNNSNSSSVNIDINNNLFEENTANNAGGVFYNKMNDNSILDFKVDSNKFTTNIANQSGGVLYNELTANSTMNLDFINNTVEGCGSVNGGVIYNTATTSNISHLFENNLAIFSNGGPTSVPNPMDGGVIFQEALLGSTVSLVSNSNNYVSNIVNFRGGAIFNRSDSSTATVVIVNDIFARNSSGNFGGAICNDVLNSGVLNTNITNSSFLDQNAGMGISFAAYNQNTATATPLITNVSNSIFWQSQTPSSSAQEIETFNTPVLMNYSIYFDYLIDGTVSLPSWISGANNLDSDPLFTSPNFGDLTLQTASPAIDVGDNNSIPALFTTDNYGSNRIYNNTVDLGAVEYIDGLVLSNQQFLIDAACSSDTGAIGLIFFGGVAPYTINGVPSSAPFGLISFQGVAGTYQFNVTDANGWSETISATISEPSPLVLSATGFSSGNASVTVTGGTAPYSYQWNDPNTQTSDVATGLTNGTYTVLVTDANGCTEMATVSINLVSSKKTIVVDNQNALSIFPNPSTGKFSVVFELHKQQSIRPILYNLQGQIVYEFTEKSGQKINYEAHLEQLPTGTYALSTFIDGKQNTQFIILK